MLSVGLAQLQLVTEHGEFWTEENAPAIEAVPAARAVSVEPADGWEEGGVLVDVSVGTLPLGVSDGATFPPFACQFGTIAPVASRAGSTSVRCAAPAAKPGARRVGVVPGRDVLGGATGGAPVFTHLPKPEVTGASPTWAPAAGGVFLTFHGSDTLTASPLACFVDGVVAEASSRFFFLNGARLSRGFSFAILGTTSFPQ